MNVSDKELSKRILTSDPRTKQKNTVKCRPKIYTGQVSNYAREPDANDISQLSWECASHSLGDINMA